MAQTRKPASSAPRLAVKYVTAREAAAYLGISLPTLLAMRKAGTGPAYVRISDRRFAYDVAALDEYAASRTIKPTAA